MKQSVVTYLVATSSSDDNDEYNDLHVMMFWFLWGYRGGSPTVVRPSDPALCGSCPL